MTINEMISIAADYANANGESLDGYWGEYPRVMQLLASYYRDFNVGGIDKIKLN